MVLQSWITECLELLEIADNIKEFKTDIMKARWQTELTSLSEWEISRFGE